MFDSKSTVKYVILGFRYFAFPFGEKGGKSWKIHYYFHKILTLIRKEQKCIVKDVVKIRRTYIYSVRLGSASVRPRFSVHVFYLFFFFFFFARICWLWETIFTVMNSVYTVHVLKNIKNGCHDTIYTFKNYFATVFSVFSSQFSTTISSIQTHPLYACNVLDYDSMRLKDIYIHIYIYIFFFFFDWLFINSLK